LPAAARRLQGAARGELRRAAATATGKIQKFELRAKVGSQNAIDFGKTEKPAK
jgi:fatty-acyl-CoA synthase